MRWQMQARVAEIRSLTDTLTGIGGLRRTFQTLPRHLRRRTMSHSLKRYPLRLRQAAQREFERDPNLQAKIDLQELRNRRLKRQVKYAMSTYARRAREHVWLETHLWHTKRMHMDNIWGHRMVCVCSASCVQFYSQYIVLPMCQLAELCA
jgi:ribonuclease P/MRP protein subunit POP1